jgi:hypothetical protein
VTACFPGPIVPETHYDRRLDEDLSWVTEQGDTWLAGGSCAASRTRACAALAGLMGTGDVLGTG